MMWSAEVFACISSPWTFYAANKTHSNPQEAAHESSCIPTHQTFQTAQHFLNKTRPLERFQALNLKARAQWPLPNSLGSGNKVGTACTSFLFDLHRTTHGQQSNARVFLYSVHKNKFFSFSYFYLDKYFLLTTHIYCKHFCQASHQLNSSRATILSHKFLSSA